MVYSLEWETFVGNTKKIWQLRAYYPEKKKIEIVAEVLLSSV